VAAAGKALGTATAAMAAAAEAAGNAGGDAADAAAVAAEAARGAALQEVADAKAAKVGRCRSGLGSGTRCRPDPVLQFLRVAGSGGFLGFQGRFGGVFGLLGTFSARLAPVRQFQ